MSALGWKRAGKKLVSADKRFTIMKERSGGYNLIDLDTYNEYPSPSLAAAKQKATTVSGAGSRHHATKSHEYDPVAHVRGVRAREIVRLAAEQVKDPSTRYWLLADDRGTFEKAAKQYLAQTAGRAQELRLSNDNVNGEIATMIALSAVEAFRKRQRASKR